MKPISNISDPRLVKAMAHPLRVRILAVLGARTASPNEIAEELGAALGNVSYHVRVLAEFGLIRLVRRTPRRGAIEHHYEAVGKMLITDRAWAQVPDSIKEAMVGASLEQVADYVRAAARMGGFDAAETHLGRYPLTLDEQGFSELSKEVRKLHERAQEIQAQSAARLTRSDHEGEREIGLVLLLFEARGFAAPAPDAPAARTPRPRQQSNGARQRSRR